MLIIIVCSFTELLIEITEKLKSQQRTKRAKNLRKRARAAILPTNAFKLQISAQKKAPRLVLVNILVAAQRRTFFHVLLKTSL